MQLLASQDIPARAIKQILLFIKNNIFFFYILSSAAFDKNFLILNNLRALSKTLFRI